MRACYKIDLTKDPLIFETMTEVDNNVFRKRKMVIDQLQVIKKIRQSLIAQFGEDKVCGKIEGNYSVVYVD